MTENNKLPTEIQSTLTTTPIPTSISTAFTSVNYYTIDEKNENQRIDNFLLAKLKGVPKSHIYKIIRNHEVRVNKKRIDNTYKLVLGDIVRIPPLINIQDKTNHSDISKHNINIAGLKIKLEILYEDDAILAINKPAGMAVHGGSGVSFGIIEYLREQKQYKFLELIHRLDKETSGVLLLAKKRSALVNLHEQIRNSKCNKRYHAVVSGSWQNAKQHLRFPLKKIVMSNGERKVFVDEEEGQESHTIIYLLNQGQIAGHVCSFLEAELKTGRTHQIRVHLSHSGYPILGDEKYGNFALNKQIEKQLNLSNNSNYSKDSKNSINDNFKYRMYLHAYFFAFTHPISGEYLEIRAHTPWTSSIIIQSEDE